MTDLSGGMTAMRLTGPVVIVEALNDPGDFGEPRVFQSDGATVVVVPSFDHWRAELFHGHHPACGYTIDGDVTLCGCGAMTPPQNIDVDRLVRALDDNLPRMAYTMYGQYFTADFDLQGYYRRVAEAVAGHSHIYSWDETKAAHADGKRPACRICGEVPA